MKRIIFVSLLIGSMCCRILSAQEKEDKLDKYFENLDHKLNTIEKLADDILWYHKIGDVARIDKVYLTGPPLWKEKNPTAMRAGDLCSTIASLLTRTGWASLAGVTGGHSFNRMDTKTSREIRLEIYRFLDQYLSPPRAFKSVQELEK